MVRFQDSDDAFQALGESRGQAIRFQDIDGIGPATASKIKNVRGVRAPTDVQDMSADELADKAGISRDRASKAINGAGGNPNVSKQSNTGTVSAAGIRQRQGDFWVEFTDMDKARARNDAQSRSAEAVRTDEQRRAPITTDLDQWKDAPGRWDFPGVDTPTQEPGVRPKDYKAGGQFDTADFDEQGRAEFDDQQEETFPRKRDAASGKSNFILETGDERIVASDIAEEVPSFVGAAPGMSPRDVEIEGGESMVYDGLGGPRYNVNVGRVVETDPADEEFEPPAEALERQSRGAGPNPVDLPKETLGVLQTELNKKVYEEEREDLRGLRERVRRAGGYGEKKPLPLSSSEHAQVREMLREQKEEAEERAERMDANIFGSTEDQAEMAREAYQGVVNNPPRY